MNISVIPILNLFWDKQDEQKKIVYVPKGKIAGRNCSVKNVTDALTIALANDAQKSN